MIHSRRFRSNLKLTLALAAALAALAPAQAAGQTSIVVNGDFESPVVVGNFGYFAPPGFDSWTVDQGSVDLVRDLWTAASGAQSLDLTGACCEPGSVSQVLSTTAGAAYALTFAFAGNPDPNPVCGSSAVVKQMEVFWGGTSLGVFAFDTAGHTLADPGWQTISLPVTASSGVTTLRFTSLTSGACGPALDAVSVTEGLPHASRKGRGCGDKIHVHAGEADCRKPPRGG